MTEDKQRQIAMAILKANNEDIQPDSIEPFLRKLCIDNGMTEETYFDLVNSGEIFHALLSKIRLRVAVDANSGNTQAMKLFLELFDAKYRQKQVVNPLKMYEELTEAEKAIRLKKVEEPKKIDISTQIANNL